MLRIDARRLSKHASVQQRISIQNRRRKLAKQIDTFYDNFHLASVQAQDVAIPPSDDGDDDELTLAPMGDDGTGDQDGNGDDDSGGDDNDNDGDDEEGCIPRKCGPPVAFITQTSHYPSDGSVYSGSARVGVEKRSGK